MNLNERLAKVRLQLRARIEREGRELVALTVKPSLDAEDLQQLRFLSHGLAGSAPMFDYPAIGATALAVEDVIRDAAKTGRPLSDAERADLDQAAARFETIWQDAVRE